MVTLEATKIQREDSLENLIAFLLQLCWLDYIPGAKYPWQNICQGESVLEAVSFEGTEVSTELHKWEGGRSLGTGKGNSATSVNTLLLVPRTLFLSS